MNFENDAFFDDLTKEIISKKPNKNELAKLKLKLCKKHNKKNIPTDIEIGLNTKKKDYEKIKKYIASKPTRTISGVAVVAIMSYPYKCPHGECTMCPSKTDEGIPQSYTGNEPATMRALRHNFDSYMQVFNRLEQYIVLGQNPDKVELIIMGGTFPSFKKEYQREFVRNAYSAMNDFSKLFFKKKKNTKEPEFLLDKFKEFFELPGDINKDSRTKSIQNKINRLKEENKTKQNSLEAAQKTNETTVIRCVGLTIETRPDYAKEEQINEMLKLGTTRIELGVQTTNNEILKKINRGHDINETIRSTKLLKDSCFKINYHMMIGLPGQDEKKDLKSLNEIFKNQDFQPDMLKIYPCMVMKESELYEDYKKNLFTPITTEQAAKIIAEFKPNIPTYCRVMRVQRDIPTKVTVAGVDKTNLRQYVEEYTKKYHLKCRCIRCREVEHVYSKFKKIPKNVKLVVIKYKASDGTEYFISAEDTKQDIILGFCRLRFPDTPFRSELKGKTALIRELHVYGTAIKIGTTGKKTQHKGWGTKLLQRAELIAKKSGYKKMAVISGIGVREYYRKKHNYKKQGPYMVKKL